MLGSLFHLIGLLRGFLLGLLPLRLPRRFISSTIRCTTRRSIFRVHTCPQVVDFRPILRTYSRPQRLFRLKDKKAAKTWTEGEYVIGLENERPAKISFRSNQPNRSNRVNTQYAASNYGVVPSVIYHTQGCLPSAWHLSTRYQVYYMVSTTYLVPALEKFAVL